MLVLSRHRNESIRIGDDIEVMVVEIRGDKVRLGIKAPAYVPVHRQEVYDAIQRQRGTVNSLADQPSLAEQPVSAEEIQDMIDSRSDPQE